MMNPISPISGIDPIQPLDVLTGVNKTTGTGFHQILSDAINTVESAQTTASRAVDQLLTGKGGELHSAVLSTERAELQFQLFLQVRNKVMSAYQQVMQVQV